MDKPPSFFHDPLRTRNFLIIDAMQMCQREIRERSEYTLRGEGAESGIDVTSDERHEIAPANFVGAL